MKILKGAMLKIKTVDRKWYLIDAKDKVLGRLATRLARILSGKNKVRYVPYLDKGDYCIVLNASKVFVTGRKRVDKKYYRHTGYPGGIKVCSFSDMLVRSPEKIIEIAVRGMLPKGPLGRMMHRKLRVYSGSEHPHSAQKPHILRDE